MRASLSVIIATRNRKKNISSLLESIMSSVRIPDAISIVSSGEDIYEEINKFNNFLKIIYQHSNITGQVAQRKQAIANLDKNYDINIFLDDDVTVAKNLFLTCEEFFKTYLPGGVGFKIHNKETPVNKLVAFMTLRKGRVLKSGININYQELKKVSRVDWLNGISAWSSEALTKFKNAEITNKYAAAEDLIFSFQVGKHLQLYFHPNMIVFPQDDVPNLRSEYESYVYEVQHKLFFVLTHLNKSFYRFVLRLLWNSFYMITIFPLNPKIIKLKKIKVNLRAINFILKNKKILTLNSSFKDRLIKERLL